MAKETRIAQTVYFEPGLHERLTDLAAMEDRSFSAQVGKLCEERLEGAKKEEGTPSWSKGRVLEEMNRNIVAVREEMDAYDGDVELFKLFMKHANEGPKKEVRRMLQAFKMQYEQGL